ncbi:hypothetical protein V5N11_023663 [Cardamine amara subsp. amara]|uniref:DUF3444 domain-containing protein n=1 Tax=Cardamine amara subsp. amara TaxID=228776 RepID=A0ABD1B4J1_CARAN
MEPDSSPPPRDTPEQNPVPSPTEEPERLVEGFKSIAMDRNLGERFISQVHENALSIIEFSRQWDEYDKEMELKEKLIMQRFVKLEKKEERLRMVEERERKVDLMEASVTQRLTALEEKENESDLIQSLGADVKKLVLQRQNEQVVKKNEELMGELEARRKELDLLSKSIHDKSCEFEMKVKDFDLKQTAETERMRKESELIKVSLKQLEARENELRLLSETISEKSTELEEKEENFQLKQQAGASEIEAKTKFLELKEKELEEKEKELELKLRELEDQAIQAETQKRSRLEFESSLLPENGRDAESLILPGKKHKPIRENHNSDEEKESYVACVLHGKRSPDPASVTESEHTSEAKIRRLDEIICIDEVYEDPEPFNCPDPDFHDFNNTMRSFSVGQVWALYDPIDDMPRYYALIEKILKRKLSLLMTWLEAVQTTENEELIPIACGDFKLGKSEIKGHLTFSHEMHHITDGESVTIYPRKGETWALFRDWTKTWIRHREQHKPPYRYDFVEVLSEFDSNQGIGVAYLGKVEGFTSVYKHAEQHGCVKFMLPSDEMLRFSHRVPSFKMSGDEKEGVPAGSFELDPAAVPQACFNAAKDQDEDYAIYLGLS